MWGGVVVFALTVGGAVFGVWFRIENKVAAATARADKVADELAAHKLHVAESYLSKAGIKDWKDEILAAMASLKDDLRHLSSRIDGMK
jgi:hypothetical protein